MFDHSIGFSLVISALVLHLGFSLWKMLTGIHTCSTDQFQSLLEAWTCMSHVLIETAHLGMLIEYLTLVNGTIARRNYSSSE